MLLPQEVIDEVTTNHFWTRLKALLSNKQDTLQQGSNITITNNVISASSVSGVAKIPVDPDTISENGALWYDTSPGSSDTPPIGFSFLNAAYPIGSVYLSFTNVNPSTFLGGSWTQIAQGRAIIGVGTGVDDNNVAKTFNAGDNGGEYTHGLTTSEIPAHTHTYTRPGGTGEAKAPVTTGSTTAPGARGSTNTGSSSGTSSPHNNLMPSFGVYIWKRVS